MFVVIDTFTRRVTYQVSPRWGLIQEHNLSVLKQGKLGGTARLKTPSQCSNFFIALRWGFYIISNISNL